MMLSPARVGDSGLARTFARPHREVVERLAAWRKTGQLTQSEAPALYLHEYTAAGITIRGLVGVLDISHRATRADQGAVFPHEGIYPAQADDLADRMRETHLNPAPILLVHRSPPEVRALLASLADTEPTHAYTDRGEQHHRVWEINDTAILETITRGIGPSRALIADGHHRYAAYLRLQQREAAGPADFGLAMLVDQGSTPLFLGAIHRTLDGSSLEDVEAGVGLLGGRLVYLPEAEAVRELGPGTIVATDNDRWAVITLNIPQDRAVVEIFHHDLIPRLPRGPHRISYHHSAEAAIARSRPGVSTAVLLPAPGVDLVLDIVAAGRLLPEKATSFQPKPNVGVLIRSLDDG